MAVASRSSATDPSCASLRPGKPAASSWSDGCRRAIHVYKRGTSQKLARRPSGQGATSDHGPGRHQLSQEGGPAPLAQAFHDAGMPRLLGVILLALGLIIVQIIRHQVEALYTTTLGVRVIIIVA